VPEEQAGHQRATGNYIAQADHGSTAIVASYEYAPPRPVDPETLDAARRRLAELPLEQVPDPGPLSHGSRMYLSPNPLFVGREDKLKTLAAILKTGDATRERVATVAVTGMGGVGKSQLANEFVHRYRQYFLGGVFWLSFADANAVPGEVASCGGAGTMELRPDFRAIPLEDQVREVMSAWQSPLPRLLVFDNCENQELVRKWRPRAGGCRVVITSRRGWNDPTLGVRSLQLDVLSRDKSIALLGEYSKNLADNEDPTLNAIASELGDLPLALHMAGSYLRTYRRYRRVGGPAEYLSELRRPNLLRHPSLQEPKGISATEHEQNVARTFELSYQQLNTDDSTDALAVKLLARAALFAPGEPIPTDLLLSTADLPDDRSEAGLEAEDALDRIVELGLLEEEAETLRMHRLVAAFVRDRVADEEAQTAVEAALLETVGNLLNEGYPTRLLGLLPHLRSVTDVARQREDEQAALLCNQLAYYLQMVGEYAQAKPLYERALTIREEVLGPEHPDTAQSLDNLAVLLDAQGDYAQAKPLYERALAIYEEVLGPEHPNTEVIRQNLQPSKTDRRHSVSLFLGLSSAAVPDEEAIKMLSTVASVGGDVPR